MRLEMWQCMDPSPTQNVLVEMWRRSAEGWRESARGWRDRAVRALGDSDLPAVVFCLNRVAERNEWAIEDDAAADRLEAQL